MDLKTIVGIVGVSLLLFAYFLQSIKVLKPESSTYFLLNIIGAFISAYSSYLINFLPFIVLELTWGLVSLIAFIKLHTQMKMASQY